MPKYTITETYTIETNAKPEMIKGKIITGEIPFQEYENFSCEVKPLEERFIFHSFEVNDGEHTYTINHVESLETCMAIAKKTNTEYTSDDELLEDSHMHLVNYGFEDMDDIDDCCLWNPSHTAFASISCTREITKEEYLTLKKYL